MGNKNSTGVFYEKTQTNNLMSMEDNIKWDLYKYQGNLFWIHHNYIT